MGAEQGADVNEIGHNGEQHRHPAVVGDIHSLPIVRGHVKHIPNDPPDVEKGHQGQQGAGGGQDPGGVGEVPVAPRVIHQP